MNGALINALGIIAGGASGLAFRKPLPAAFQTALQIMLGVFTIWFGLKQTWNGLNGSFRQVLGELGLIILALSLGKLAGQLLHLQKMSNSIGRRAANTMASPAPQTRFNDGFMIATSLFCAGPLALLASIQEGLTGFSPIFVIKAGIDGLATYAFCQTFGWGVILSAIPVLALESALTRGAQWLEPILRRHPMPMTDTLLATNGLLIFCVAMLIFGIKKIEVADYFPSLVFAPCLTLWLWR